MWEDPTSDRSALAMLELQEQKLVDSQQPKGSSMVGQSSHETTMPRQKIKPALGGRQYDLHRSARQTGKSNRLPQDQQRIENRSEVLTVSELQPVKITANAAPRRRFRNLLEIEDVRFRTNRLLKPNQYPTVKRAQKSNTGHDSRIHVKSQTKPQIAAQKQPEEGKGPKPHDSRYRSLHTISSFLTQNSQAPPSPCAPIFLAILFCCLSAYVSLGLSSPRSASLQAFK